MEKENQDGEQDQREEHSLPGTNQAGKGPASCDDSEDQHRGGRGAAKESIEEHSLPGTNQAGKGPSS